MTRARLVSTAGTVLVLICATLALVGIVRFMGAVHRGWGDDPVEDVAPTAREATPGDGAPGVDATPVTVPDAATTRASESPGSTSDRPTERPSAASPREDAVPELGSVPEAIATALRARGLTMPVAGVRATDLVPSFTQARGERTHEALDIMAPAGTAVVAVEDGTVAKLFTSKAGGLTVYHFDPSRSVAYYYAHLQRYAPGLEEGDTLRRGEVIGYVGSTGNADPTAPHLHFAIFRLGAERRWWEGTAIDPYVVLR